MDINNNLYTAIITPMDENGEIDYSSFEKLLRFQADSKCGILILGSTGEALALSYEEQCKVVEFTCSLELDSPIMVGVGGYQLNQQIKWINFCNNQKIDSFLLVTPLYAKPGTLGQTSWFRSLLDTAQKPCILYNVPSRTGVNLSYDTLENLKNHENLWALKEASGDFERFENYIKIAPNLKIYSGEDAILPELVNYGAIGLISVIANIWPQQTKKYVQMSIDKTITNDVAKVWKQATAACFEVANPIPVKVWLTYKEIIKSNTLRSPLIADELNSIKNVKDADTLINTYNETI